MRSVPFVAGWDGSTLAPDVQTGLGSALARRLAPDAECVSYRPTATSIAVAGAAQAQVVASTRDEGFLIMLGTAFHEDRPGLLDRQSAPQLWEALRADTARTLRELSGSFVVAFYDARDRRWCLAVDRFASIPLHIVTTNAGALLFSSDYAFFSMHPEFRPALNAQALYDYLFFSIVPSSHCIHKDVRKLAPATVAVVEAQGRRVAINRYWTPAFQSGVRVPKPEAERIVRDAVRNSVARFATLNDSACFLSGGLDSSTVSGMAAPFARTGEARAYTMGFAEPGYDEMAYARIASRHFGLDLREHYVTAAEVLGCLNDVANAFPEPFGNASALPAYICARRAAGDGIRHMLAGDGGDELFAGNERYQKQLLFELYGRVPRLLRERLLNPLATHSAPASSNKLASYIRQAAIPLPDRLFTYNLLVRNPPESILNPDFLRRVDTEEPLNFLRSIYATPENAETVDRMLYLDWTVTLADNDLRKVRTTCELAGVTVHFPMLTNAVVNASLLVPPGDKVTMKTLRAFYKAAFRDFLPAEILSKPKHGFGVPVGMWIANNPELRSLVYQRLASLKAREILNPAFLDQLIEAHQSDHVVYFGAQLWPLFMLEQWLQTHSMGD